MMDVDMLDYMDSMDLNDLDLLESLESLDQLNHPRVQFNPDLCLTSTQNRSQIKMPIKTPRLLKHSTNLFNEDNRSDDNQSIYCSNEQSEILSEADKSNLCTKMTINCIKKRPLFYIGIPKTCYCLIKIIQQNTGISEQKIMLCLKKLRLNNTFEELGKDFSMPTECANETFANNIPKIAKAMQSFIVKLNGHAIKKTLPVVFRHKYYVTCIIDVLEIVIEKPSIALNESLTWSKCKKANTIKYLISYTPNGLVNYISPGYGGSVSNAWLVENCEFLNCLPSDSIVMADKGFKDIDQLLEKKNCKLMQLPDEVGSKSSKTIKQFTTLNIQVNRVTHLIREFLIFQCSYVNSNIIEYLDDITVIICGLINLQ